MEKKDFYKVYSYSDNLEEGKELTIKHSISFCEERADLAPLVCLPVGDLVARKAAFVKQENAVFEKLCASVAEWEELAAQTTLTEKALEYLRTPAVKHTSNQWKKTDYDYQEISNMVYKMTYRISEDTRYDRTLKKSVPYKYCVTWNVVYNAPSKRDYYRSDIHIAGQTQKAFSDKAAAERYLQGRIAAYAHLFTEVSPPIPEAVKNLFTVNGQLLPDYTMEQHTPTVSELLDFLDDDDFDVAPPEVHPKAEGHKTKATTPAKAVKKKPAPTR